MNQLIVILLILRNWMKPFASSILKLSLCIIALIISFYIYQIYNEIPTQETTATCKAQGMASIMPNPGSGNGGILKIEFNYEGNNIDSLSHPSIKLLWDVTIAKKDLEEPITASYLCNSLIAKDFKDSIMESFNKSDFLITTGITTYCDQNNWLFPLPLVNLHKSEMKSTVNEHNKDYSDFELSYSKKAARGVNRFLGYSWGKERHHWVAQTITAGSWNHRKNDLWLYQRTEINADFYTPKWYSAYDVSKIKSTIWFDIDYPTPRITISFGKRIANISELIPYPDEKTIHGIAYDSPEKIAQIKKHGLEIYATFPEYESLQQTRNYVLSALITLFLTLSTTVGWNLACSFYKRIRRLNRVRKKAIFVHDRIYIKLNNYFIANIIVFFTIINSIIYFINPYDWSLSAFLAITNIIIGFGISDGTWASTYRLARKRKKITNRMVKYVRHSFWLGAIFVTIFTLITFIALTYDNSLTETGLSVGACYLGSFLGAYIGSYFGQKTSYNKTN